MFQLAIRVQDPTSTAGTNSFKPFVGTASQHYYGQTLKWGAWPGDQTPLSQNQDYIDKTFDDRPVLYIGTHGHATYFRAGTFKTQTGPNPGTQIQYEEPGILDFAYDDTRTNAFSNSYPYELRTMKDNIKKWKGRWGEAGASEAGSGPRSPFYRGTGLDDTRADFVYMLRDPKSFSNMFLKSYQASLFEIV
jgi:hypothetical protein